MEMFTIKGLHREINRIENQRQQLNIGLLFSKKETRTIASIYDQLKKKYQNRLNALINNLNVHIEKIL